ncbi:hypothetical protein SLE2022_276690 [Rubroshorea leprosula]
MRAACIQKKGIIQNLLTIGYVETCGTQASKSGFSTAPLKNTSPEVSSLIMNMKGCSATNPLRLKDLILKAVLAVASVPSVWAASQSNTVEVFSRFYT